MTFNFFTTEQSVFQKTLVAPDNNRTANGTYNASVQKDTFTTSKTSGGSTEKNDQFEEILQSLKNKKSDEQQKTDRSENAPKSFGAQTQDSAKTDGITTNSFYTEEAAITVEIVKTAAEATDQRKLANVAALNAEIQRLIEEQSRLRSGDSEDQTINVTEETQKEKIKSVLSLLNNLLGEEEGENGEEKPVDFISILGKILDRSSEDDAAAITSGLTPEQLTKLQEQIQKYLNEELSAQDQEVLEALASQWITLVPPKEQVARNAERTNVQNISEDTNLPLPSDAVDTETTSSHTKDRYESRYDSRYSGTEDADAPESSHYKTDTAAKDGAKVGGTEPQTGNTQNNVKVSAGQEFLQTSANATTVATSVTDSTASQAIATATSQASVQSSATSLITQTQHAAQSHPATQIVSATIQRAVKAGEDTNIKIQLDPPELGRVEIKMSIDKDNTTRIVLTAEKPETYVLLKNDAQALEKALADAGLDTQGELNFELASEGHDFDQRQSNSGGKSGGHSNDNIQDDDLIYSTMDWSVDPETGHMHYNIWA